MTTPSFTPPFTPPQPPPAYPYTAPAGSAAEKLLDQLDEAKAAEKEAKDRVKDLVKSVEAEVAADIMRQAPPGSALPPVISIAGAPHRGGWVMRWMRPWRIDSDRMKREQPLLYATWAKQSDGYWQLDPAKD